MHTFRLLHMAKEIAQEGIVHVYRSDRSFLLDIKVGKFEYDELVQKAEVLKAELETLYAVSNLPIAPKMDEINTLLSEVREKFYQRNED